LNVFIGADRMPFIQPEETRSHVECQLIEAEGKKGLKEKKAEHSEDKRLDYSVPELALTKRNKKEKGGEGIGGERKRKGEKKGTQTRGG